jgi:hypothetical protein
MKQPWSDSATAPANPIPANDNKLKVCIVATIRAPLRETLMFVSYHLNVGIDHIFIFFDDPQDQAISALEDNNAVTCVRCDESYWQENGGQRPTAVEARQCTNNSIGLIHARKADMDWAIFVDHDELLYTRKSIRLLLAEANADVVRFRLYEAVSERMHYENLYATSLFKTSARSVQIRLATMLGCRNAFFEGKYFRGHLDSKVAVSLKSGIKIMGIHGPAGLENSYTERTIKEILLLHFDCVGFEAWKAKGLKRIEPGSVTGLRGNRLRQQELFADALGRGDEEELKKMYREMFTIPRHEQRILRLLGMMTTVNIDPILFLQNQGNTRSPSE